MVALERAIAEAPHWGEAEYAAIVNADGDVDGAVRRCLLVAEADGRLLGFAVGKVIGSGTGSVAELESVAVDAAARRGGVGRALCAAVVAWCQGAGGGGGWNWRFGRGVGERLHFIAGWGLLWSGGGEGITGSRWRMQC